MEITLEIMGSNPGLAKWLLRGLVAATLETNTFARGIKTFTTQSLL